MSAVRAPLEPERPGRLRWLICSLLFAATALNYVDRQTIGILEPQLAQQLRRCSSFMYGRRGWRPRASAYPQTSRTRGTPSAQADTGTLDA